MSQLISRRHGFLRRQAGVSLLEVLVAVVVLSIGFVGYAALQMLGVRTNNESVYRTQAIILAESMVERMYANRSAINDVDINGGRSLYDGIDSGGIDCGAPPTMCDRGRGGVDPANCNIGETVTWDAYAVFCGLPNDNGERLGGIEKLLPEGSLTVSCDGDCLPTSTHTVQVQWEEFFKDDQYNTLTVSLQVVP